MKIDLRELQEGETEFTFEETPEDLHLTAEDAQIDGLIKTKLIVYRFGDALSAD